MVYNAGGVSTVWSVGDAFCKVKILDPCATREHVTLNYLYNKRLSFATPNVHYHAEHDGRYYIILSRLTGQTLNEAWPNIDESIKQHYVSRIADICQELAMWRAHISAASMASTYQNNFLLRFGSSKDCSPQNLSNCKPSGG